MSKILEIRFNSGSTYNIDIFLVEVFELIGVLDSDITSINPPDISNTSNAVSGYTSNRLSEIRTFNYQRPYQIGINGVTNITYNPDSSINSVYYVINGINYITDLTTNTTIYSYTATGISDNTPFSLIKDDNYLTLDDEVQVDNLISIERPTINVLDPHYRTQNINNLADFLSYAGGNYFNVY